MRNLPAGLHKYLFARQSRVQVLFGAPLNVFVCVEAFNIDHALTRLERRYPFVRRMDWDYLDECDPETILGPIGDDLLYTGAQDG